MRLTVTVTERTPGTFTFHPAGSIDSNTSSLLEAKVDSILKGFAKTIIFDMEGVNYISSAGIRVIIKVQKSMKQQDGQFLMTNLQPQVKKVFEIINALPTMHVFSSIQELDRYLDLMQKKVTG
ncbi:MAG: STAS domain-containing protein, partial [Deltaproteobacteria bacterium]|nr:STAS domain-containing protein [Deltaproteobacteria bacterium]